MTKLVTVTERVDIGKCPECIDCEMLLEQVDDLIILVEQVHFEQVAMTEPTECLEPTLLDWLLPWIGVVVGVALGYLIARMKKGET